MKLVALSSLDTLMVKGDHYQCYIHVILSHMISSGHRPDTFMGIVTATWEFHLRHESNLVSTTPGIKSGSHIQEISDNAKWCLLLLYYSQKHAVVPVFKHSENKIAKSNFNGQRMAWRSGSIYLSTTQHILHLQYWNFTKMQEVYM